MYIYEYINKTLLDHARIPHSTPPHTYSSPTSTTPAPLPQGEAGKTEEPLGVSTTI